MHSAVPSGQEKYEVTDAHVKGILVTGVVLMLTAAAAFVIGYWLLGWSGERPAATDFRPSPLGEEAGQWEFNTRLQDDPAAVLTELKARQTALLHSGGVISELPEILHIPIEVAIDLVAENGFPKFVSPVPTGPASKTKPSGSHD